MVAVPTDTEVVLNRWLYSLYCFVAIPSANIDYQAGRGNIRTNIRIEIILHSGATPTDC